MAAVAGCAATLADHSGCSQRPEIGEPDKQQTRNGNMVTQVPVHSWLHLNLGPLRVAHKRDFSKWQQADISSQLTGGVIGLCARFSITRTESEFWFVSMETEQTMEKNSL